MNVPRRTLVSHMNRFRPWMLAAFGGIAVVTGGCTPATQNPPTDGQGEARRPPVAPSDLAGQ